MLFYQLGPHACELPNPCMALLQIIVKEKGVFTNVTSPSTKAKLRILFEVAPLALLVMRLSPPASLRANAWGRSRHMLSHRGLHRCHWFP